MIRACWVDWIVYWIDCDGRWEVGWRWWWWDMVSGVWVALICETEGRGGFHVKRVRGPAEGYIVRRGYRRGYI